MKRAHNSIKDISYKFYLQMGTGVKRTPHSISKSYAFYMQTFICDMEACHINLRV